MVLQEFVRLHSGRSSLLALYPAMLLERSHLGIGVPNHGCVAVRVKLYIAGS